MSANRWSLTSGAMATMWVLSGCAEMATDLPEATMFLAATATSLKLAWDDNADNEDGFDMERNTGTSGAFTHVATLPVNTTTHLDEGLVPDMLYCYRVRAYNSAGHSAWSNDACARTKPRYTDGGAATPDSRAPEAGHPGGDPADGDRLAGSCAHAAVDPTTDPFVPPASLVLLLLHCACRARQRKPRRRSASTLSVRQTVGPHPPRTGDNANPVVARHHRQEIPVLLRKETPCVAGQR